MTITQLSEERKKAKLMGLSHTLRGLLSAIDSQETVGFDCN